MKRILFSIVLSLSAIMLFATPYVAINRNWVGTTKFCYSFAKNNECTAYYIVAAETGSVEQWIGTPFAGATLELTIKQWGIQFTTDSDYTWTGMTPNTDYVVYVAAENADDSLVVYTDTLKTNRGGGSGESVITVSATDITDCGATLTATPNDQTVSFRDAVITKYVSDSIYNYYLALDSATAQANTDSVLLVMLQLYGVEFYEEDSYVWTTLNSGTDYLFIAAGINSDSIWSAVASVAFKTTGEPSAVEDVEVSNITIYPNPASDYIIVNGAEVGESIQVIDVRGNVLVETYDNRISLAGFVPGIYFVRTANSVDKFIVR